MRLTFVYLDLPFWYARLNPAVAPQWLEQRYVRVVMISSTTFLTSGLTGDSQRPSPV